MKVISAILSTLLSRALAYTPCALQSEFDTVMCESKTCTDCVGMDFCTNKCIAWQKKYPLCRCVDWPCSRPCYDVSACPNDEDRVECVDPEKEKPKEEAKKEEAKEEEEPPKKKEEVEEEAKKEEAKKEEPMKDEE